jgi:PAS domain S-box-containing protein
LISKAFPLILGPAQMQGARTLHSDMEPRLSSIIDNLRQAVVILDHSGRIIYSSAQIKTILGYESRELIGKSAFDLMLFIRPSKARLQYEMIVMQEKLVVSSVLRMKHKDGKTIWTELTATNLLQDRNVQGVLLTVTDITDRRKSEEQKLAQRIAEFREKERHAIATELHDNINQMIVASSLLLETAIKEPDSKDKLLLASSRIMKDVIAEIRKLSSSLVCYSLEDYGFLGSVERFVETIAQGIPLRIVVRINKDIEGLLTTKQKLHIFRIIQEQVTNIVKHANASKVLIGMYMGRKSVMLKISDDGIGFDVTQGRKGIGLYNMNQRAKAISAHMHITSAIGGGTSIILRVPV